MTWPVPLPDWMPWWVPLLVLVPALLYLLLFLAMPFSVFGLKGRLEQIEAQLDEIQADLRRYGTRAQGSTAWVMPDELPPARPPEAPPSFGRPPPRADAPPPRADAPAHRRPPDEGGRVEPRLDWPRS